MPARTAQWLTTVAPDLVFNGAGTELMFGHTGGWQWEEGTFVGQQLRPEDELSLSITQRLLLPKADLTIFSSENVAREVLHVSEAMLASGRGTFPMGKVGVRCVGAPGDNIIWDWLAQRVHAFNGLSTIGDDEGELLAVWAKKHGYNGSPIHVCPLGAEVVVSQGPRVGFVYLGSCVPEKQVLKLLEAVRIAKVPFTFALALAVPGGEEQAAELIRQAKELPFVRVTSVGLHHRKLLLATSLGAVTMSRADSQWLPGTEARACGGIALAHRDGNIQKSNGEGIFYSRLDDVDDMARYMRELSASPSLYAAVLATQQAEFTKRGLNATSVGKSLVDWMKAL